MIKLINALKNLLKFYFNLIFSRCFLFLIHIQLSQWKIESQYFEKILYSEDWFSWLVKLDKRHISLQGILDQVS